MMTNIIANLDALHVGKRLDLMPQMHKILVVDDIPANIQLLQTYLATEGYKVLTANNGVEALTKVENTGPDLIVLDVMMPVMDGFETCRLLKSNQKTHHIPIIIVTALNEIGDKIKGIEAGADDFITKPFNKLELLARVKSLLRIKTLHDQLQEKILQLEQAKERMRELAVTDGLTGLYNYRYFREYLTQEILRAKRHQSFLSLIMFDIDYFKVYNDANGHLAGDEVLKTIAKLMVKNIRKIDVGVRYGGEEFAIILPQTNRASATIVAKKIKDLVEYHKFHNEITQPNGKITISVGVSTFPSDGNNLEELVRVADARLYMAKAQGKNQVVDEG